MDIKSFKILLVEDEDKIRKHLAKSLKYLVGEVKEVQNGEVALEVLKNYTPDIIITDIEMPIMNGIELVKEIRKTDKDTIIIVLTAYDTPEYLKMLIDMHLEKYIIKPINFDKIMELLSDCEKLLANKTTTFLQILPLEFTYDTNKKRLFYKNKAIKLTKKEILFIELLSINKDRIVTYKEFQNHIWQDDVMTDDAIKSLVKNLRRKLPIDLFENLSGVGYKIV